MADESGEAIRIGSSDESLHFFEGVEKLLEIWFEPIPNGDLRKIPRTMWDALLKSVRCEIISFTQNEQVDAYVLSESSMFVSRRRWILKTCGTTTPLECLAPLLRMAEQIVGYTNVEELFYSRKNFKRPDLQQSPHRGFDEEVALLDTFFDDGRAYCLGSVNRDCWYVYTLARGGTKAQHQQRRIESACDEGLQEPDQTIEILMTELDVNIMSMFTKDECSDAKDATNRSGIHKILPGMVIDDYLFEPCGYSMNGVSKTGKADDIGNESSEGCYMTIHITPEPEFSYVSFESNVAATNYGPLIARVIETFQPGKFVVTLFSNKSSSSFSANRDFEYATTIGEKWKRQDLQFCRFPSYDLTYAHYCKFPS